MSTPTIQSSDSNTPIRSDPIPIADLVYLPPTTPTLPPTEPVSPIDTTPIPIDYSPPLRPIPPTRRYRPAPSINSSIWARSINKSIVKSRVRLPPTTPIGHQLRSVPEVVSPVNQQLVNSLRRDLREQERRADALLNGLNLRAEQADEREVYVARLERERERLAGEVDALELQLSATRCMAREFSDQRDVAVEKVEKLTNLRRAVNDLAAIYPIASINMYKIHFMTASDTESDEDSIDEEGSGDEGPAPDSDSE